MIEDPAVVLLLLYLVSLRLITGKHQGAIGGRAVGANATLLIIHEVNHHPWHNPFILLHLKIIAIIITSFSCVPSSPLGVILLSPAGIQYLEAPPTSRVSIVPRNVSLCTEFNLSDASIASPRLYYVLDELG